MDPSKHVSASFVKHDDQTSAVPNFILLVSLLPYISVGRENPTLDHFPLLLLTHLL